jgi:glyoxylase-like metal-dependent hydrolase (beta-lactamase superfamily II)/ferredoxin
MADPKKSVPENVEGEFFVDTTCIDCDTCRQIAPQVFDDAGEYSFVHSQPHTEEDTRDAVRALLSCPTGSIGTLHPNNAKEVRNDFPLKIEGNVFYCGFNSPKSYGGNSYFIKHSSGNWLIDSPKFIPHLVTQFERMGGIDYIFLTHRDDVADADKYAERFHSQRVIHKDELSAQPDAEYVVEGQDPVEVEPGFVVIPTPGHTGGHCVLLYENRYLFTGDHMWWSRSREQLGASQTYSWFSWPEQKKSIAKLQNFTFEWVLPGHGDRVHLPVDHMRQEMSKLVDKIGAKTTA